MSGLRNDISYSLRVLRRSPGFSLAAILILTLGIGANTAIFSVVNAVLLKPLPFADSGAIVSVAHVPPPQAFPGISDFPVSPANYLDWRKQSTVFESMAVIGGDHYRITVADRPQSVSAIVTEPDFFSVLRAQPAVGRFFTTGESAAKVLVASHAFAERHFGSDTAAVGKTLNFESGAYRIIGVLPASFRVPSWFPAAVDAYVPLNWGPEEQAERRNHNYEVIARLKPGVTVDQAQAQMTVLSDRLAHDFPEENKGWGAIVVSLRDQLVGRVRPALLTLLGAVVFVLLISCANVANLVLARTLGRAKELAIRSALGAGAGRALRTVLVETMLLALAGGALGLLFAQQATDLVVATLAAQMPRATEVRLDAWVLIFTLVTSLLTGAAAATIAAWRLLHSGVNDSLKQGLGKTDAASGGNRTRSLLVVAEVALSLMLLVGAGLMVKSLNALRNVNPGFDANGVITMTVPIPQTAASASAAAAVYGTKPRHASSAPRNRFYSEFLPGVRAIPGVQSAGAIDTLPLRSGSNQPVVIEGRPAEVFALQPNVDVRSITPGYFAAMRIPIVRGRDLNEADTLRNKDRIVISESMARQFWPGQDPVGRRLTISFSPDIVREIVGVVGDVKQRGVDYMEPVSTIYEPLLQSDAYPVSLVVRSNTDPGRLVPAIEGVLRRIDPQLPVREVLSLEAMLADSISQHRFSMFLLTGFAALALVLAAVGIYSVLAYSVRRRSQEIAVRVALGAQVSQVLRMVIAEGMKPTAVGALLGVFGAFAISRVLSKIVPNISSTDPLTLGAVLLILIGVALLACLIPALRATRVEPIEALRND